MEMQNSPDQIAVGQTYDVPCAELRWKEDGRIYYVPVLENPHSDPELGFPHHHYHIDGRFEIHPRIRHRLEIAGGYTRAVILTGGSNSYDFNGLVNQNLLCERKTTGLLFPVPSTSSDRIELYAKWYQQYVGRVCKGKRCPHFGTKMHKRDGQLVCPMHHLVADADTLRVIPYG
jgi:hypothetical protein